MMKKEKKRRREEKRGQAVPPGWVDWLVKKMGLITGNEQKTNDQGF